MNENQSYRPLVVGVYRDALDLGGYRAQLDAWERWFAREERFALLRRADMEPPVAERVATCDLMMALVSAGFAVPDVVLAPSRVVRGGLTQAIFWARPADGAHWVFG